MLSKPIVVFDIEIFRNYLLVAFKRLSDGKIVRHELGDFKDSTFNHAQIRSIIARHTLVSFNGINFDHPILSAALKNWRLADIKDLCNYIIETRSRSWMLQKSHGLTMCDMPSHIDLIEVAPLQASLKIYGARLNSPKLQALPIPPESIVTYDEVLGLRTYCDNDLNDTEAMFNELRPQIELRLNMDIAYVSKSDAQIAEAEIKAKVYSIQTGEQLIPESVKYVAPVNIKFKTDACNAIYDFFTTQDFKISPTGHPEKLAVPKVELGEKIYVMGLGGIHSKDSRMQHTSSDSEDLVDIDVTAYYPNIILNNRLYPDNIGPEFLEVYGQIVKDRIEAKRIGDKVTDKTKKIVINGLFGKFGSKYSTVYSPKLLLQTTITGQLTLLMLIEALELGGIPVLSANTDGVLVKTSKRDELAAIISNWEISTGYNLESTYFKQVNYQNVNNYLSLTMDGDFKGKGLYINRDNTSKLHSSPKCDIIVDAIEAFIRNNVSVADTIYNCNDPYKFLTIRTVNGGAVKDDKYLSKVVRWYYGNSDTAIHYIKNGYKVPKSQGSIPLMDVGDITVQEMELDYEWYINEVNRCLKLLGVDK